MPKRLLKDSLQIGKTSMALGAIGNVTEKAGGSTAPINTIAGFMPSVSALSGASAVLRQTKKVKR